MPSIDVYSDFTLIVGWYWYHHWKYALSMTIPLMLQFLATIYKWIRLEKRESKKWSWPLLMLQFWPQWRALRIIHLDFKNDEKTGRKKKVLMQEVNSAEPFLEAWPSIIIMTVILIIASFDISFQKYCLKNSGKLANSTFITSDQDCVDIFPYNYVERKIVSTATFEKIKSTISIYNLSSANYDLFDLPTKYCNNNPEDNNCSVFGGFGGSAWFLTTYFISIISAAFGITRFLQIGPFSMLNDEGPLRGMCTWRFVIAFLAVITSLLCKGFLIALSIMNFIFDTWNGPANISEIEISIGMWLEQFFAAFAIFFLPHIIFAIISLTYSTGLNRKLIELILSYPASWMLPVVTNFAIGPRKSFCKSKATHHRHQLAFSTNGTILNIILTLLMYTVAFFKMFEEPNPGAAILSSAFAIAGSSFTIIYLLLDRQCCCGRSQNCFCKSCCGPECYKTKIHVIDVSTDELKVVHIDN